MHTQSTIFLIYAGYQVPNAGLFKLVTAPNYLGEIIEWIGFALAAQTFPSFSFAVFTACFLGGRAAQHNEWYRRKFRGQNVAKHRLIPYLW